VQIASTFENKLKPKTSKFPALFSFTKPPKHTVYFCEQKGIVVAYHAADLAGVNLAATHLMDHRPGLMIFADASLKVYRTGKFADFRPLMKRMNVKLEHKPFNVMAIERAMSAEALKLTRCVITPDALGVRCGFEITSPDRRRVA
jgi:hypothetical protein